VFIKAGWGNRLQTNELDISKLDLDELKGMSKGDVHFLLCKERDAFIQNREIADEFRGLFKNSKRKYIDFLKLYLEIEHGTMEIYNTFNKSVIYTSKLTADLIRGSEDEFFDILRRLYITGFIENSHPCDVENLLNAGLSDDFDQPPTVTVRTQRNLLWLYRNHSEQFDPSRLITEENEYRNATLGGGVDTPEKVFEAFYNYGTVSNLVCSQESMTGITSEGLQLVFAESISDYDFLVKELKLQIGDLDGARAETEKQLQRITKMNKNHSQKIQNFYKDIGTILSILVAAFAVIGINLSAIPKIDGNFMVDVISLNLSVLLCISFMFYGLQRLVFDFGESPKNRYMGWYILIAIFIILLAVTFVFGRMQDASRIASLERNQILVQGLQKQIVQEKQQIDSLQKGLQITRKTFK
jgi:hypothetical protein